MTTLKPAAFAPLANAYNRSGVRWAETMRFSQATPSAASVSAAWRMVSQSDWLPMMMAIGAGISLIFPAENKKIQVQLQDRASVMDYPVLVRTGKVLGAALPTALTLAM